MSTFWGNRYAARERTAMAGVRARFALARLVTLIGLAVAVIIAAGVLLVVLHANLGNDIASAIHDAARWLAGPFDGLFKLHGHSATIALNWGLAAVVYLAISWLIARLLVR